MSFTTLGEREIRCFFNVFHNTGKEREREIRWNINHRNIYFDHLTVIKCLAIKAKPFLSCLKNTENMTVGSPVILNKSLINRMKVFVNNLKEKELKKKQSSQVCYLPVAIKVGSTTGRFKITCQHFEGCRFPCTVDS